MTTAFEQMMRGNDAPQQQGPTQSLVIQPTQPAKSKMVSEIADWSMVVVVGLAMWGIYKLLADRQPGEKIKGGIAIVGAMLLLGMLG